MKILAFTDIHENKNKIDQILKKAKEVDILVCTGDFTYFSNNTEGILKKLAKTNKPVILIHGNHESWTEVNEICKKYENLHFLHGDLITFEDVQFFGLGGGGFSYTDKKLEAAITKIKSKIDKKKKLVLLTHAPPYGDQSRSYAFSRPCRLSINSESNYRFETHNTFMWTPP